MKLGNFFRSGLTGMDSNGLFYDLNIGIVRKYMSKSDQDKKLPSNSIYIVSTSHLYNSFIKVSSKIKLVCHPFGEKNNHFFGGLPCYDICESDMVDPCWCENKKLERVVDVMCITNDSPHGMSCKGFHYIPCIAEVCKRLGLSFVVIDYTGKKYKDKSDKDLNAVRKYIKQSGINVLRGNPKISHGKVNGIMQGAKIMCIPNYLDASPKIITESIIRGVPVALGDSIVGGKKYINKGNGVIFSCAKTFKEYNNDKIKYQNSLNSVLFEMISKSYDRNDMINSHMRSWGLINSSKKLADILSLHGLINKDIKYVFYPEFKKHIGRLNEVLYK